MDLQAFEWCIFIIFFSFPSSGGTEAEAWKVRWYQKRYQDGYQPFVFLCRFAMRKEVLCRRSIFLEINMVILWLGFLILFLVSLVRRRVLILRIGSRRLLLRMNGVVMVFLLGGLVRGLFLLLILVWIWLLLRKKLNQTEQSLPLTERRCATQTRSRDQLCFLHLSILKSLNVIRDSFNVIFPLFVYLWGL